MDEIENDALSMILFFDDLLLPIFLEWSSSIHWSDWVLFLMETDILRFKSTEDRLRLNHEKVHISQSCHFLTQAIQQYRKQGITKDYIIPSSYLEALQRLNKSKIPLYSAFSKACDEVWRHLLIKSRQITSSPQWPNIQKTLLADQQPITVNHILDNEQYRKYLERYLQSEPCELASLQCWVAAKKVLEQVESLHKRTFFDRLNRTISAHKQPIQGENPRKRSMFKWRFRNNTNSVKFSSDQSSAGSFKSSDGLSKSVSSVEDIAQKLKDVTYTDPVEAFKILLLCLRSVQKEYFPAGNVTANAPATFLPPGRSTKPLSPMSASAQQPNCAGLSEPLRIEIAALLSYHNSLQSQDIDAIDTPYALTCAKALERLLMLLEQEMYSLIISKFASFQASNDYAFLVALMRCEKSLKLLKYDERLTFLYDKVQRETLVHWAESQSGGTLFISCENDLEQHSNKADCEDASDGEYPNPYLKRLFVEFNDD